MPGSYEFDFDKMVAIAKSKYQLHPEQVRIRAGFSPSSWSELKNKKGRKVRQATMDRFGKALPGVNFMDLCKSPEAPLEMPDNEPDIPPDSGYSILVYLGNRWRVFKEVATYDNIHEAYSSYDDLFKIVTASAGSVVIEMLVKVTTDSVPVINNFTKQSQTLEHRSDLRFIASLFEHGVPACRLTSILIPWQPNFTDSTAAKLANYIDKPDKCKSTPSGFLLRNRSHLGASVP